MKAPDEGKQGQATGRPRGLLQVVWDLYRGAAKGIREDISRFLFAPDKGEEDKSPSERLDEFWEKNAYRVSTIFVSVGVVFLLGAFFLEMIFSGRELVRSVYYLFIFVGAGLAAAIATWRGRQFEKSLRESRIEKALEMITEKGSEERVFLGFDILGNMRPPFPLHRYLYVRLSLLAPLRIEAVSDEEALDKYHAFARLRMKIYNDRISEESSLEEFETPLIKLLPPPLKMILLLRALQQGRVSRNSTSEETKMYAGKVTHMHLTWGLAVQQCEFWGLAYVLYPTAEGGYVFPNEGRKIFQKRCFYGRVSFKACVLRYVDFSESVFCKAKFFNVDFTGSIFDSCAFYSTCFDEGTCFEGASFKKANISNCDFHDVKGLQPEMLKEAFWVGADSDVAHRRISRLPRTLEDLSSPCPLFPWEWHEDKFWEGREWPNLEAFLRSIRSKPGARYTFYVGVPNSPPIPNWPRPLGHRSPSDKEDGPESSDDEGQGDSGKAPGAP